MMMRLWKPGLLIALLCAATAAQAQPAGPKIDLRLVAAQTSIQPDGTVDLAIVLPLPEGWHTYYPIRLDTGDAMRIRFDVPEGVTFGPLAYPAPVLEDDGTEDLSIEYLGLEGEVVVLTTLQLAADAVPGPLPIKVHVFALVCKELCVPWDGEATLTIPVSADPPAAANEELFNTAREALPVELATAANITGTTIAAKPETLKLEEQGEIVLNMRVRRAHHIFDPNPGAEGLVGTRLFIEPLTGLKIGKPEWPAPHVRTMEYVGEMREHNGTFAVRVPVSIDDPEFVAGPVTLRALLIYQCCADSGSCFPEAAAVTTVTFTADTPNAATPDAEPRGTLYPEVNVVEPGDDSGMATPPAAAEQSPLYRLLLNFVFSFLGGLLLNIMPCVFPVISIKILSFVKQAGEDHGRVLKLGLAFCAGIMVWFWLFAVLTIQGQIPWQHPPVVIGLAAVLFLFALNMFGVFEITLPGAASGKLDELAGREGYSGAFLKGLLATLLGTACTAPFFASAAAYAATQGGLIAFIVFTGAGLGMSSPYVLLAAFPGWLKSLPKPGAWMVTFKQFMGFVLIGTVVWLLLIVGDLLDAGGVVWTVALLSFFAFSAWLIGRIRPGWSAPARWNTWAVAVAIAVVGWWFCFAYMYQWPATDERGTDAEELAEINRRADEIVLAMGRADWNEHIPWQEYYPGLADELSRRGYTVYVDYTATWCVTCQTNKGTALDIASNRERMREMRVIPLEADYTRQNPRLRAELLRWESNSVPVNVLYPADHPEKAFKLPVVLTPGFVVEGLEKAGPSTASFPTSTPTSAPASAPADGNP
ncbi:MAG: protein-disulfide reductase DsbD family protein [Phycisphaerae bacterium]|jgi:thiol:disulfide interchange protein DsbD